MTVIISRPVVKPCPFRPETDIGHLEATIPGDAPELHALAEAITRLGAAPISHEDYTRHVLALLPSGSQVVTRWQTGPWEVEVREP